MPGSVITSLDAGSNIVAGWTFVAASNPDYIGEWIGVSARGVYAASARADIIVSAFHVANVSARQDVIKPSSRADIIQSKRIEEGL
jgi:hypothetical protein